MPNSVVRVLITLDGNRLANQAHRFSSQLCLLQKIWLWWQKNTIASFPLCGATQLTVLYRTIPGPPLVVGPNLQQKSLNVTACNKHKTFWCFTFVVALVSYHVKHLGLSNLSTKTPDHKIACQAMLYPSVEKRHRLFLFYDTSSHPKMLLSQLYICCEIV